MKRIDAKFLIMGLVLLLAGLIFGRILILVAGAAFIIIAFSVKHGATKENLQTQANTEEKGKEVSSSALVNTVAAALLKAVDGTCKGDMMRNI